MGYDPGKKLKGRKLHALVDTEGLPMRVVVLPRCWVVERTFAWFGRNRRLAKDFENLAETLAAFVAIASIQIAIRRLARR